MKVDDLTLNGSLCFIGTLAKIDRNGCAFVDFPENEFGPLQARVACAEEISPEAQGTPVLLVFDGGDPCRPIILGFVRDRFSVEGSGRAIEANWLQPPVLRFDGRQIRLSATDQIVLQCGRGSITLSSDGSIEIKGTRVTSRSSGAHKIRGATVQIN
jgi:Domain of unknown function (DUF6484)